MPFFGPENLRKYILFFNKEAENVIRRKMGNEERDSMPVCQSTPDCGLRLGYLGR